MMLAAGIPLLSWRSSHRDRFRDAAHGLFDHPGVCVVDELLSMMIGPAVGSIGGLFTSVATERNDSKVSDPIAAIENITSTWKKPCVLAGAHRCPVVVGGSSVPVIAFQTMALGMDHSSHRRRFAAPSPLLPAVLIALCIVRLCRKARSARPRTPKPEGRWVMDRRCSAPPGHGLQKLTVNLEHLIVRSFGDAVGTKSASRHRSDQPRMATNQPISGPWAGAAAPAFVTVDATTQTVVTTAPAISNVVDACIVTELATTGRAVVRVTPWHADRQPSDAGHGQPAARGQPTPRPTRKSPDQPRRTTT
jgi:hypothetical protein